MALAMVIGMLTTVSGLTITYFYNLSPGAAIVVLAILIYAIVFLARPLIDRVHGKRKAVAKPPTVMHPERQQQR